MLIAIASKSGKQVDQHFGQAETFRIYDYGSQNPCQVSEVSVDKFSQDNVDHSFEENRFKKIVTALAGCKAVAISQIGKTPAEQLLLSGIKPVKTEATIAEALKIAHDSVCSGDCKKLLFSGECPHQ
ncbi:NifB/NifX family molybdenum-iron cluster-binding protein [uncultured Desulfuromusa sp.]|uniref:NifB/NifX family molybdenum-iron cluster-binding protein n=1 Tax=uncultured Desulfuromusa sp. TaxID=219183 RepID=UPI002AA6CB49|nr:NifB/NifX family molybdenum-iron cluster-binding protein [uncultured Desulfuromusa sp.]